MTSLKHVSFLVLAAALTCSAHAETVDLTDGIFTEIDPAPAGGMPRVFTELAGGVVFTFSATDDLVGMPRFNNLTNTGIGLHLGGANQSVIEFTLETSAHVTLDSYSTVSDGFYLGNVTFDVAGGSISSAGNTLAPDVAVNMFAGGPLLFEAGTLYTFDVENTGGASQAFLGGIEFTVVPLPAPALLLASGLLGLAAHKRQRA